MKRLEVFLLSLKGILRPSMPTWAQTHTAQYNLKVSLLESISVGHRSSLLPFLDLTSVNRNCAVQYFLLLSINNEMLLSSCFLSCTKQFISHSLIIQIYNLYCYGKLPRRVSAFGSFLHKHWGFFFYKFYGASFHKKSNFKVSVDFVSTWNFVHILQFIIKVTLSMVYSLPSFILYSLLLSLRHFLSF